MRIDLHFFKTEKEQVAKVNKIKPKRSICKIYSVLKINNFQEKLTEPYKNPVQTVKSCIVKILRPRRMDTCEITVIDIKLTFNKKELQFKSLESHLFRLSNNFKRNNNYSS